MTSRKDYINVFNVLGRMCLCLLLHIRQRYHFSLLEMMTMINNEERNFVFLRNVGNNYYTCLKNKK